MKIGLGTYALAWSIGVPGSLPAKPMDIFGFLDFAHKSGFRLVQIADNLPLDLYSQSDLEDIRRCADSLGISVEVGTRGLTLENVLNYLEIAAFFNSPILRIVIDKSGFEPELEEIHRIIQLLIAPLQQKNIKLAIENHDRFKAHQFEEIVKRAESPFIGICLDAVNSIGADEGFDTVFEKLAPYTINFHLKDFSIMRKSHMMGFDITGTPAGQGRLDLDYIFTQLHNNGRCNSAILELWPAPENDLNSTIKKEQDWVEESAQYLFKKFNQ